MSLSNILKTFPRDELFQIGEDELFETALDILHLFDRPKVKLFVRLDDFDRFASALLYVPRDRYDSRLRIFAGELLAKAYGGRVSAYYPSFSDSPLARVQFIIGMTPGGHLTPDVATIEASIARAARTWTDDLDAVVHNGVSDQARATKLLASYAEAFPIGYRDRYDAAEGFRDLIIAEALARRRRDRDSRISPTVTIPHFSFDSNFTDLARGPRAWRESRRFCKIWG